MVLKPRTWCVHKVGIVVLQTVHVTQGKQSREIAHDNTLWPSTGRFPEWVAQASLLPVLGQTGSPKRVPSFTAHHLTFLP